MRIVSQDKMVDINYSKVAVYVQTSATNGIEDYRLIIGTFEMATYTTKERALEVMEEINACNTMLDIWKIRSANMSDKELTLVGCSHLIKLMEYSTYYMPKE